VAVDAVATQPPIGRLGIGVVLLGLSFGYAAGVVGPAAAPLSHAFHVSLSAAGLLTSVFFIAIAAFALFGATIEERLGIPSSARLAAVLMCLGAAVTAASPWFSGVLVGRAVAGLGTGIALIAAPVIARALKSILLLGLYGGGITFGLATALFVGGELEDAHLSWRINFAVSALVAVAALPFLLGRMPAVPHMRRVGAGGLKKLLLGWRFWRVDMLFIFINGIPIVVGAWLIHYLTHHHALGAGVAGAFGFLLFGITTVARPIGGRLATTASRRMLLSGVGPVLAAAGLLALALDRTAGVAAVGIVAIALGFGAPYALAYVRVEELIEGNPELGLAVALQGVNLTAILVVPLMGAALEHGYGKLSFIVLAAYCALVGLTNLARRPD
jgi:predicted MFS family arabinose efflux permease